MVVSKCKMACEAHTVIHISFLLDDTGLGKERQTGIISIAQVSSEGTGMHRVGCSWKKGV